MKYFQWFAAFTMVAMVVSSTATADDKEDNAKKELKSLEGSWQLKAQEERGGLKTPDIIVANLYVVIEGDKISWYTGDPAPNQAANITIDPSKDPKTIDALITRGAKDKKMLGIYKLDKDILEVCWAEPGSDKRPEKFTSKPGVGSGYNYTKYERKKDKPDDKKGSGTGSGQPSIKKLQVKLPDKWKDDSAEADIRTFVKQDTSLVLFATLYSGKAPATAEDLAELAKKDANLFPHREWLKTTGVGKFTDGVFIVGTGKAGGFEHSTIGVARTLDGTTILFLGTPADDAAARKEMLDIVKSAQFEK
jgi:uncharacterized protein (TIGR03067 family)